MRAGRNILKVRDWLEKLEDALFDAGEILDEAPDKKTNLNLVRVRKQLEKLEEKKPTNAINRILSTRGSLAVEEIAGELEQLKEIVSGIPGVLDDATSRAWLKIPKVRDWLEKLEDALFDVEILKEAPGKRDSKLVRVRKQLKKLVEKKPDTNPVDVSNGILKTLRSLAVEEIAGELQKLKEIIPKIPGVLDTISARGNTPKVRDWLEKLEDALFDADEILDEALGKKTDSKLVRVRKQLEKLVEKKPLFDQKLVDSKLEGVRKQLEELVEKKPFFNPDDEPVMDNERENSNNGDETGLLGGGADTEELINLLLDSGIDETVSVISIFGLEGIGNTKLARRIFNDARVKTSFQLRLWAGVSELEVSSIADQIIKSKTGASIIDDPEGELEKFVEGKKLLLVLDDVQIQKIDSDKWLGFKRLLMGGAEGSRVLITTCRREVVSMTATVTPYEEKLLSAKMALEYFNKHYGDLPQHLKDCIAYCSLFPKDHEFDESTLKKIWVAQGFTSERNDPDSGQNLDILVHKEFFRKVQTEGSATQSKCKIADAMPEVVRFVGGKRCINLDSVYQISGDHTRTQSTHNVSFDFPLSSLRRIPTSLKSKKRIRSLVVFPYQQSGKCKDGSNQAIFDAIVSNFKSLRTLDLHYSGIRTVPRKIDSLEYLRFLDLSKNTKMKVLPNSITKLRNLQTLKLSWCFELQELPRDIKKLVKLRHLEIDGCYNLTHMPSGLSKLTDLQTLSQFVLREDANTVRGHVGELQELRYLKKLQGDLQIRNLRPRDNVRYCLEKKDLQSLTLDWVADDEELHESSLSEPITIPSLAFNGYGGADLLHSLSTYQSLKKLELRRCSECKFLPPLHSCTSLKTLVLDDMTKLEYIAEDKVIFPKLEELRLTELPMLKGWWKSTSPKANHEVTSFPTLSKLSIEDCPELVSMPPFPKLKEGLVLDSIKRKPFEQMMIMADRASSSSSSSSASSLSDLKNLSIIGIEELKDIDAKEIKWEALKSLQFLRLEYLPGLESLPDGLRRITSLRELNIWRCNFTHIPDWIGELKSLKKLSIWVCPKMESLPQKISSMKLLTLEIEECPMLLQRCLRNAGADWEKISRIPDLRLGRMSKQ
ncbi:hypothetical protein UlMin_007141 [Ulmus minor]